MGRLGGSADLFFRSAAFPWTLQKAADLKNRSALPPNAEDHLVILAGSKILRRPSPMQHHIPAGPGSLRDPLKVNKAALHIRVDELHAEPLPDVHAFKATHQPSFNGRMKKTDPRALRRCAGDNGIEPLSHP
jgi:hypothetical protein